jgi:plasmid stability protein
MSTAYQASLAAGTKGECREGKVRHTVTLDRALFEAIRAGAMEKSRSVSEEMAARLTSTLRTEAQTREVQLATSGP